MMYLHEFCILLLVSVSIVELLVAKVDEVVVDVDDEFVVGDFCSIFMMVVGVVDGGNVVEGVLVPKLLFEVVTSDT